MNFGKGKEKNETSERRKCNIKKKYWNYSLFPYQEVKSICYKTWRIYE